MGSKMGLFWRLEFTFCMWGSVCGGQASLIAVIGGKYGGLGKAKSDKARA